MDIKNIATAAILTSMAAHAVAVDVGGIINSDSIWDNTDEPYEIIGSVQVAPGVTLTIKPGVTVNTGSLSVFGNLNAIGTAENPVIFNGTHIRPGENKASRRQPFRIDLQYSKVTGGSLYGSTGGATYGSLNLSDSILTDLPYIYLWYPVANSNIERNIFINSGEISAGLSGNTRLYIANNVFIDQAGWSSIMNWAAYDSSTQIVEFNSFLSPDRIALALAYSNSKMIGMNNYWGTSDQSIIESMIWDRNDDLSLGGYIDYRPFLLSPHPSTPIWKSHTIGVNISPIEGGSVTCTPNPVNDGMATTCIASPVRDYSFDGWGSDCFGEISPTCVLQNVTEDRTVDALFVDTGEPHQPINAAVLPYARAIEAGQSATAFATIINNGDRTAYNCRVSLSKAMQAEFIYQTTNTSNTLIGIPNEGADIPSDGAQGYAFAITPLGPIHSQEIPLIFECDNAYPAPSHIGLNTFILTATDTVTPDLLAIGVTPSGDGVVKLDSSDATGFFATAAVNIGSAGLITVRADDGGLGLPANLHLCETNAVGQQIACGNDLTRTVAEDQTVYYTVFVTGTGEPIPFDPSKNRLFLRFAAGGTTVGATNVAVTVP